MKILIVSITPGSAVDRLSEMVQKHNEHLDIEIFPFHPKRYSKEDLRLFEEKAKSVDLIDFQYWKSALVLLEKFPWLKDKKKILTHHNPYNLQENSWKDFDVVVVKNETQKKELPNSILIRHGVDMDFFEYKDKYPYIEGVPFTVGMVAFRIEGKKGIAEVAKVCHDNGFKFLLVGHISKPDYFKDVVRACPELEFREDVSDEELRDAYREMDVHVCNSVDGFESGCYDDKTEILTNKGWRMFKDLDKTEEVATLNPNTNELEYKKPYSYIEQNDCRELYSVSNRSLDFAVTPNHNMWVSTRTTGVDRKIEYKPYGFIQAQRLPQSFKILRNCEWNGNTDKDLNWFRFLGIYLAEGSLDRGSENYYRINITAVKEIEREKIEVLLKDLEFEYEYQSNNFRVKGQNDLARYLEQFGNAVDKYIPKEVLHADVRSINEFVEWFCLGDGRRFNGARVFYTSSQKIADGIQECLIKIGNNGNISVRDRRGQKRWIKDHWIEVKNLEYIVYEKIKKREGYVRKSLDMSIKKYNGKVYCVEVENHILLVRRNGKAMFCGNTMPILEAMASGTPVLTRNIGLVPDVYNGENMVVRSGEKEDVDDLADNLLEMSKDIEGMKKMRDNAWNSVRMYSDYRMAKEYAYLYNKVLFGSKPLVSIITPTFDRKEYVEKIIDKLTFQTYPNIEFIVCDDCSTDGTESVVKSKREQVKYPIKYVNTNKVYGYNLAMARNLGVEEADGEYIMFLDSRLLPDDNAVSEFLGIIASGKYWVFGNKGGAEKKSFVENFSAVKRKVLIEGGMFNERIDRYGGMSQEVRARFQTQGVMMMYVPEAKAEEMITAKKTIEKRKDILKMKNLLWKLNL